jgi:ABC-type bacteriocin/lantibiotic exporter with double-glycine peptidase domain
MHHEALSSAFVAITASLALIFGKSLTLASTSTPEWVQAVVGPFGTVVVMGLAVLWFAKRMERAEAREVDRQKEREALLAEMVKANVQIASAMERNSQILDRVESHLDRR